MCGRTACTLAPDDLVRACSYRDKRGNKQCPQWKDAPGGQQYLTSYNMAPGAHMPVIQSSRHFDDPELHSKTERVIIPMKWGLTPSWHKDDPYKVPFETNNCRVEGMLEKKTYKVPLHRGFRCVVLVDGYYEWKTSKDGKQPYFFHIPQPEHIKFPVNQNTVITNKLMKTENLNIRTQRSDLFMKTELSNADQIDRKPVMDGGFEPKVKDNKCDLKPVKNECQFSTPNEPTKLFSDAFDELECKHNTKNEDVNDVNSFKTKLEDTHKSLKRKLVPELQTNKDLESEWSGQRLLTIAAVYDIWQKSKISAPLYSFSVITVPSAAALSWCHHRMPAILSSEEDVQAWLDFSTVPLQEACRVISPKDCLTYYPVSKSVNNSKYKGSDCLSKIDISKPKSSPSSNLMMNWLKSATPVKKG